MSVVILFLCRKEITEQAFLIKYFSDESFQKNDVCSNNEVEELAGLGCRLDEIKPIAQVFEGLSHAQYISLPQSSESKQAWQEIALFFNQHLKMNKKDILVKNGADPFKRDGKDKHACFYWMDTEMWELFCRATAFFFFAF